MNNQRIFYVYPLSTGATKLFAFQDSSILSLLEEVPGTSKENAIGEWSRLNRNGMLNSPVIIHDVVMKPQGRPLRAACGPHLEEWGWRRSPERAASLPVEPLDVDAAGEDFGDRGSRSRPWNLPVLPLLYRGNPYLRERYISTL
jgi:hypothetical protein